MKYRVDKYGNKLSVLGFGCMRFKKKMGRINMVVPVVTSRLWPISSTPTSMTMCSIVD